MPSLTEHLRRPIDHGRLPFHPECPVCREERLAGTLPDDALVGRRTPALLAAGILAFSTAAPATTLAAEPPQEQEGSAAPDPNAAEEYEGELPDAEPEWQEMPVPDAGDDVVVPDDEPPADEVVPAPDAAAPPDEPEPAADPGASAPPAADALPAPDPGTPAPVSAPVPDGAASPVAPESAPASDSPIGKASSGQSLRSFVETPAREQRARTPATVSLAPAQPTAPVAQSSAPAGTVLVTTVSSSRGATSRSRPARRGDRTHVVAPGESLWSIADDLLGEEASVARVAREVNRLWELNSRRIGTGDPSLVHVGTTLLL